MYNSDTNRKTCLILGDNVNAAKKPLFTSIPKPQGSEVCWPKGALSPLEGKPRPVASGASATVLARLQEGR